MALVRTTIGNMALGLLSAGRILDIDSTTDDLAVKIKFWLEPSLRQIGRRHWNCLGALSNLARDVTNPDFGHSYRYELPNDCMLLRKVNGYAVHSQNTGSAVNSGSEYNEPLFQIFGRFIHTDDEECKIEYTQYVTDTSQLDGAFAAAYACLIAANSATSILNSGGDARARELYDRYRMDLLPDALVADGNERKVGPADVTAGSRLLSYRMIGTRERIPYGS